MMMMLRGLGGFVLACVVVSAGCLRDVDEEGAVPLIVLKNPRSGSSWLVALLNSVPSAFVTEEILTSKSAGHGDVKAEGEAHLGRALGEPMGRFGRGSAFGPDERKGASSSKSRHHGTKVVAKDRAMRELGKKPRESWDLLGFTVSPKRILGLNLFAKPDGVFWQKPRCRVVLYERTNKIKQAIAYARGRLLRDKCGMNNVRKKEGKPACTVGKTLTLDTAALKADLLESMSKDVATRLALRSLLDVDAARLDPLRDLGDGRDFVPKPTFGKDVAGYVFELAYEELLADAPSALLRLFDWLGKGHVWRNHLSKSGKHASTQAYSKATSDDLRDVVVNFDEVKAWLQEEAPCLVAHLEATDPGAVQADDCSATFETDINHRISKSKSWSHARANTVMELKINSTGNVGYKRARAVTPEQFRYFQAQKRR